MSTYVIARLTFQEAARRKILLTALALGLIFLAVYGTGLYFIMRDLTRSLGVSVLELNEIRNFLLMAGLYVVNFLTVMMTVLTSVDTLSGEIASGTIHTLVSKPVRRWEIVVGKWVGFSFMLTLYLLLMAGGVVVLMRIVGGYIAPNPGIALGLMWLNSLLLLTVSLLGGARLSTLANGVLVFGMFSVSFIGGWIEQIGSFLSSPARETAVNIGIITSLILPSEALWKRAANELQSALVAAIGFSPFSSSSVPSDLMIVYSILYLVVMFALAVWVFSRRDL